MYFTTKSHPQGRQIIDMVTGLSVAVYKTGNLASRQAAEATAKATRASLLTTLAGGGHIVNDGRVYSLPELQQAYQASQE